MTWILIFDLGEAYSGDRSYFEAQFKPAKSLMDTSKPVSGNRLFILFTAFLNLAGVGIIAPVLPFITGKYVEPDRVVFVGSLLFTSYSLFQFIATPTLGAMSDRYGRRPVLLISLIGSAVGYLMLGIGGALWMLFAGRIIDGLTGGNISTIYAYAADITEPENRTRFFGLLGAAAGLGFVFGPALGFASYNIFKTYEAPLFAASLLTMVNVLWGYFALPESLPVERRDQQLNLARLNPLTQLVAVFAIPQVRLLLVATFLWAMSFACLQSNLSFLTEDQLGWDPGGTNSVFLVVGVVGIITQGGLVRRLLRFGEARIATAGLISMTVGFGLISLVALTKSPIPLFLGVIPVAFGNGLITPSLSGLLSGSVGRKEQGRIQGGNQSIQALGRVIGPLWAGWVYTVISPSSPYLIGAVVLVFGAMTVFYSVRNP
ncbi:MAG TPA: MFS transporter, partial [Phototrophicaceae bacterium]|nr:MFS transporter [Phototrophicaceae bacterium]